MLFINPVTVLILSRMLLLNYLDLRLYVCLNQNSVVLTKNGAFKGPFLCCGVFSQFRVKLVKKDKSKLLGLLTITVIEFKDKQILSSIIVLNTLS